MTASTRKQRIALVLSGGAARGAYEAGVIAYLRDGLFRDTGVRSRFDILCGSSVGAINACFMAATAHYEPEKQGEHLIERWSTLQIDQVVRLGTLDVMRFARTLLGMAAAADDPRQGGVVDPAALEHLVIDGSPWSYIPRNLADGKLEALTVSATHVVSGHTVVFVQRADGTVPRWSHDPFVHAIPARIRPQHALASAAIPVLFPAVHIDGHFYCDGGLRQNTPIAPAVRLGADRVLVVSLRHRPDDVEMSAERVSLVPTETTDERPSPYYLVGKVINALWLDHVDYDLDRLQSTNEILDAGARAFGADFREKLNSELKRDGRLPMREIRELSIQPSRDIGEIAAAHARSDAFAARARGLAGTVLRRLAAADTPSQSDLLSYLLFDGDFARQLIALGIDDARARRDDLARFFDGG